MSHVSKVVVEADRENLVIGQALCDLGKPDDIALAPWAKIRLHVLEFL